MNLQKAFPIKNSKMLVVLKQSYLYSINLYLPDNFRLYPRFSYSQFYLSFVLASWERNH